MNLKKKEINFNNVTITKESVNKRLFGYALY